VAALTRSWDWHPGTIPDNASIDETAYLETTFSFLLYRSEAVEGVRIGRGASVYKGTMFDVGSCGTVHIGDFALVHAARIQCERHVEIGAYALISWNVVIMDSYRVSADPSVRRQEVQQIARREPRLVSGRGDARPVDIGRNVWVGFDVCVLPGVHIGEGSIVGARSVVTESVPPYSVLAGNPARVIRRLDPGAQRPANVVF
jgi:acetyltransferase-like isoleucine patch superfamily enzyme